MGAVYASVGRWPWTWWWHCYHCRRGGYRFGSERRVRLFLREHDHRRRRPNPFLTLP